MSYKALGELKNHIEVEVIKGMSPQEINDVFNQLNQKIIELKKENAALKNKESQLPTSHNTGSLQCFNVECPALWFTNQCTSSKGSACSARVETQQASA